MRQDGETVVVRVRATARVSGPGGLLAFLPGRRRARRGGRRPGARMTGSAGVATAVRAGQRLGAGGRAGRGGQRRPRCSSVLVGGGRSRTSVGPSPQPTWPPSPRREPPRTGGIACVAAAPSPAATAPGWRPARSRRGRHRPGRAAHPGRCSASDGSPRWAGRGRAGAAVSAPATAPRCSQCCVSAGVCGCSSPDGGSAAWRSAHRRGGCGSPVVEAPAVPVRLGRSSRRRPSGRTGGRRPLALLLLQRAQAASSSCGSRWPAGRPTAPAPGP